MGTLKIKRGDDWPKCPHSVKYNGRAVVVSSHACVWCYHHEEGNYNDSPDDFIICSAERQKVYVLLLDIDENFSSRPEPIGIAVTSKEEAEQWVKDARHQFSRSYCSLEVYDRIPENI